MKARFCRVLVFMIASVIIIPFVCGQLAWAEEPQSQPQEEAATKAPKTKEERLRDLQLEEAEITLKQKELMMKEKQADYDNINVLYKKKLVTVQELNDARKDRDEAELAYEEAKLNLQMGELESLKAAWHITIQDTKVKDESTDAGIKKILFLTLVNTSEQVTLERTQRMINEGVISAVDTAVSPEINDIYVSIKEGESIISDPY